jgi:hypothetical protein
MNVLLIVGQQTGTKKLRAAQQGARAFSKKRGGFLLETSLWNQMESVRRILATTRLHHHTPANVYLCFQAINRVSLFRSIMVALTHTWREP